MILKINKENSIDGEEKQLFVSPEKKIALVNHSVLISSGLKYFCIGLDDSLGIVISYGSSQNGIPVSRSFSLDTFPDEDNDERATNYHEAGYFFNLVGNNLFVLDAPTKVRIYREPSGQWTDFPKTNVKYEDIQAAIVQNERVASLLDYVFGIFLSTVPELNDFLAQDKRFAKLYELRKREVPTEIKNFVDAEIADMTLEVCDIPKSKRPYEKKA